MNTSHSTLTRRILLGRTGLNLGAIAASQLLSGHSLADSKVSNRLHWPAKAKNVIVVHLVGAPSTLDLFDYKPELQKYDRQEAPAAFFEGKRFAFIRGIPKLLGTPYTFKRHGQSGQWFSELLPHLAQVSDELAFVKSLHTKEFNHGPAQMLFHTGLNRRGAPSMGSWVNYGLGSLNCNLPGYVVFISGSLPGGGSSLWGPGFLPSVYQGVEFRSKGDPVLYLSNPSGVDEDRRKRILNGANALNRQLHSQTGDPEIQTRIEQYELAFRMQTSVPELMDLSEETKTTLDAYGEGTFASQCLYARRLVERGVRFVELFNEGWDTHGNMQNRLATMCRQVDQPLAALIADLKQRGLLDETLVIWAQEFGRTPMLQGNEAKDKCGRDHHKDAFTIWMAGGGIKGGVTYGSTDQMGYYPADNPVEIRDVHATMMSLLGIDHKQLTYRFQGLDQRLTGVEDAHPIRQIMA